MELVDRSTFRAEGAVVVWASWIALDVDDLVPDGVDKCRASHRAVRTDARSGLGLLDPELLRLRERRGQARPEAGDPSDSRTGDAPRRQLEEVAS